ncbi:MAG: preprotein translocase subunit SecG [bacterium]
MFTIWVVFHVFIAIALVLVVLMQSAKGEGLAGSAFGGAGVSGAVFGGRGAASFLSRATTVLAVLFMFNCAVLAFMSSRTRIVASTEGEPMESHITRQAQAERDMMMQQQQQQEQQRAADSLMNIQILPENAAESLAAQSGAIPTEGAPSPATDPGGN